MGPGAAVSPPAGTAGTSTIARAAERFCALQRVFTLDAWIHELELCAPHSRQIETFRRERDRLVRVHRLDEQRP